MAFNIQDNLTEVNFTPRGTDPEWIVIHNTANGTSAPGTAYNNTQYFKSVNRNASANLFVDDGDTVWRCVRETDTAWHCGESASRNGCHNWNSIGIEVCERADGTFSDHEIEVLQWLVPMLMEQFSIDEDHVCRHHDVTGKSCPWLYSNDALWEDLRTRIFAGKEEGDKVQPVKNEGGKVYRLYNEHSGFHHYTTSEAERDNLVQAGWKYESVAWTAKPGQVIPVYRMYNPWNGDHILTTNFSEADNAQNAGWKYEGVPFFAAHDGDPIYRAYNPNSGEHFFTASKDEVDSLASAGWSPEGIAFHV